MPVATGTLGGTEEVLAVVEDGAADPARDPQRGVTERLELSRRVSSRTGVAVAQLGAPDADPADVHGVLRRARSVHGGNVPNGGFTCTDPAAAVFLGAANHRQQCADHPISLGGGP